MASTVPSSTYTPPLSIRNGHFIDAQGRVVLLRGVNLGGSSKLPFGYHHTEEHTRRTRFFDNVETVSFVNRPFPLTEAPVHFARLRRWGLTFVRLVITWEAIEHAGPGIYDREYLEYFRELIQLAGDYGILIYVDPHQDVWSRWTGGDGAPMWTLEKVGLEPRHFDTTKAALCIETCGLDMQAFPRMIWPTNYFKMACATMFSLFWGGATCAPSCQIEQIQVQEYLQSHYLNAMTEVAKVLKGLPNVIGFGTMNEPSAGYLGVQDLSQHFHPGELKYGLAPTPFQGMALADGYRQRIHRWSCGVKQYVFGRSDELVTVDPKGIRAWQEGRRCIWRQEGVWDVDNATGEPELLRPHHFAGIQFGRDCYVPFAERFAAHIRRILPHMLLFIELPPLEFSIDAFPVIDKTLIPRAVNATHWYDGVTLFLRAWRPFFTVDPRTKRPAFGSAAVKRLHAQQVQAIKAYGHEQMNEAPTLIGETGIPFDMHEGHAFRTGDYRSQIGALDHTTSCLEACLVSFTLWCYTSDNCTTYGDQWNREDLSLVTSSVDEPRGREGKKLDRDANARALTAFVRPYATCIAGNPLKSEFALERKRYELEYVSEGRTLRAPVRHPTDVFVPSVQYPKGYVVTVSDGHFSLASHDGYDVVSYFHDPSVTRHWLRITTKDTSIEQRRQARRLQQKLWILFLVGCGAFVVGMVSRRVT
ncbi:hypothetical protein PsorP6_014120 [Peronosclerospora sorghi]|uniref:Uncharacterized protein n=1 Tax=Peronosclerospora sorghi TaxID=230839 RepID=A0ACC0VI29_9STRA|nr:hypothetical protein PsorP6_014120 [Peronosclerospora sorghi]